MTEQSTTGTTVSRSVDIAAPPEQVWGLVSDLPGMGAFSPENRGGRWVSGSGPEVGAVFAGTNGAGVRRWSTRSTVVRAEPGRAFAFDVSFLGVLVARWSYELEPTAPGCRLTETWEDRRSSLFARMAPLATGVSDRTAFTATSIEHTLGKIKERAESGHSV